MAEDAFEVINEAEKENSKVYSNIREAAEWFHEREGEMFEREEAEENLQNQLDIEEDLASELISELVGDSVDPVIQVNNSKGSFVGVIEYREFEGSYGYIEYDNVKGRKKRVVCARCIEKAETDEEVFHIETNKTETKYEKLNDKIRNHYSIAHQKQPEAVKTGATLAAGTTVAGNRVATRTWATSNNINHSDLSDAPSDAHHSKTSSASELSDVSADSVSNAHHSKTSSASELSDISADSVSDAHHAKYTDSEARSAVEAGNVNKIQFANVEHSNLGNLGLGWDNSEGGGGLGGGLIVQDSSSTNAWVVHSSERDYDIQKNGSDANGVINFKT